MLQKSPNVQNPGRNESRNCTKYLRELWWSKCVPKALESLAGGLGPGAGRPGPRATAARSPRSLTLGCLSQVSHRVERRAGKRTHPVPSPALRLSLKHVVAQLGASRVAAGTHYLGGACTTSLGVPNQEEAALPGAEQPADCQCLFHLSPQ